VQTDNYSRLPSYECWNSGENERSKWLHSIICVCLLSLSLTHTLSLPAASRESVDAACYALVPLQYIRWKLE
jgi:hypothetical protein